jgi:hypothetical protein
MLRKMTDRTFMVTNTFYHFSQNEVRLVGGISLMFQWIFQVKNTLEAANNLVVDEQNKFPVGSKEMSWKKYMEGFCDGLQVNILKVTPVGSYINIFLGGS